MSQERFDRAREDVGDIQLLEHVNVTVPDQQLAHLFYVTGLGLTRDPYLDFGDRLLWVNVGRQQFHLPHGEPQVLRGVVGLIVPDPAAVQRRLEALADRFAGTQLDWHEHDGGLAITCPWGNLLHCCAPGEAFGAMTLGIPYVELAVPMGTAQGLAAFYGHVMRTPGTVTEDRGEACAVVRIGAHQELRFRETPSDLPAYDGHHIAVYLASFSGAHAYLRERGLVFEESNTHQYRFRALPDPSSGEVLFELEHEVRSLTHPMYGRELINRNPQQSLRHYQPGRDPLRV